MLSRLIKEMPTAHMTRMLEAFCSGEGGVARAWTESQLGLLQVALALKPPLSATCLRSLLEGADSNVAQLRASVKLAHVLFSLLKSYGSLLSAAQISLARSVCEELDPTKNMMRRASLAAIGKLETQLGKAAHES